MSMDPSIVVACISLIGVAGTVVWNTFQARSLARLTKEEVALTKAEQAAALVARYRDPLLESAYDLQSRLFNALRNGGSFRWGADDRYFLPSTIFLIGQFFGWVEILRRDMLYSDIAAVGQAKELLTQVRKIQELFSSTTGPYFDARMIYRVEQRAIGEIMVDENASKRTTIGYATFTRRMNDPEFSRWFEGVKRGLDSPPRPNDPDRLRQIQIVLIELVEYLDPGGERFPGNRTKLPGDREIDK